MPGKCIWCFVQLLKQREKKDQGFLFWKYVCWVELAPSEKKCWGPNPGTYDYDLIYSLSRCKHVKMRSSVGAKPIWLVSLWRVNRGTGTNEDALTHRGKTASCRQRQRQIGVMLRKSTRTTRNWKTVTPRGWREYGPANTLILDF